MNRLTSKVAVLTGASRAIGSAIAPAFAAAGGCFAVNIYRRANKMNELWRSGSEVSRLVRARKRILHQTAVSFRLMPT
jgi:NAD(P)-dependent dehydrogenase (short-subunit alcohol dehydrogenase family)